MSTQQINLVRDNSTLANFKQWAQAISNWMSTIGWTQSTDTGQVNWSTIAAVPATETYVYEIWKPADSLANFFLKIEYGTGNQSTNTNPIMRVSIGTATNGAGTLAGFITQALKIPSQEQAVTSTVTQWTCYMTGDTGRVGILMWANDTTNNGTLFFAVQRSLNNSGTPVGTYVTLFHLAKANNNANSFQQTLVFGSGVGNFVSLGGAGGNNFICLKNPTTSTDTAFGSIAFSPIFPDIGYFANPHDQACVGSASDFPDQTVSVIAAANMPYGVSHTYISSSNSVTNVCGACQNSVCSLLMRYD